ncbi:acetyl-CoA hydrolase/transferase C-terminal domain-containing protein [Stenotrophobium rhamnosiphilum]|uniref:Acetyl-CoA hydrolase n=1 Tax=Stenotrophobium rhamnosiphilum TaxID=2029166 RepID=A0A2T5MG10_9GAMM|nr:acetyl-CoA hydrolase/transferase C-terminal domain-containing protein [Stenotrophobium rhamnosiphilum]PTU31489.1 acetyl-CoA hydrolase [Stenotrophobium rhamnosiphilum]
MTHPLPATCDDVEIAVDQIIAHIGKDIRIGLPLGLGKPIELINALYARAQKDATLSLTIFTALSLEKPEPSSSLEKAFLGPFLERVFGDCPPLEYVRDQRKRRLPSNVRVVEFFFKPGSQMGNEGAQRDYISTNYTFAARDIFLRGCNVVAQIVAKRETAQGTRFSLSCNPDTSPELAALLSEAAARGERKILRIAQIQQNLPYMANDAEVAPEAFDLVVDHPRYTTTLFSTPRTPVTTPDFAIGLYASSLLRDGGTLQVGIGALGDGVVHATCLRHQQNAAYVDLLSRLGASKHQSQLIENFGGTAPFIQGIYSTTEMFVDGLMHLYKAGILKRKVYDFWALQQLINDGRCNPEALTPSVLDELDAISVRVIRTQDFEILQHHGFFNDATCYDLGHLIAPDGTRVIANVADPNARKVMAEQCLGTKLRRGILLHGGFFLGPRDFYDWLRNMNDEERAQICMTGVYKVNQLDHNPRLYKAQRQHARFVNTGLMATLSGSVVSDGLEDNQVISGVGGQYNFVAMAHQLPTARSILLIRAVREKGDGAVSNIVFNYGHCTIPRHLRDIIITEYGIADLRAKTDNEVIKALINVADSRFQTTLLEQAKKSGKLEKDYVVPAAFQNNTPQALREKLAPHQSLFPDFPFGSDFTPQEELLAKSLQKVKSRAAKTSKWKLLLSTLTASAAPAAVQPYLERMQLVAPTTLQDKVARHLLIDELGKAGIR